MAAALLQVLMAISSGVLGGRIASSLSSMMEEGILSARGRVSVRSLKLLYRNITYLDNRIRTFLDRENATVQSTEITKRNYEELASSCRSLQDQATSSIENWTDVVPEANIAGAIDAIAELRAVIDSKNEELQASHANFTRLATQLDKTNAQSQTVIDQKEAELLAAQQELAALNAKLSQATAKVSSANSNTLARLLQAHPKPPSLLELGSNPKKELDTFELLFGKKTSTPTLGDDGA